MILSELSFQVVGNFDLIVNCLRYNPEGCDHISLPRAATRKPTKGASIIVLILLQFSTEKFSR